MGDQVSRDSLGEDHDSVSHGYLVDDVKKRKYDVSGNNDLADLLSTAKRPEKLDKPLKTPQSKTGPQHGKGSKPIEINGTASLISPPLQQPRLIKSNKSLSPSSSSVQPQRTADSKTVNPVAPGVQVNRSPQSSNPVTPVSPSNEVPRPSAQEPDNSAGRVRKKQRMESWEKICRVCGDKAVAHNFDVITCESCKTFFRRNANKPQKSCQFGGACQITVTTRRFCPFCRLQKCLDIGMRADMILDESERQARMEKIRNNRQKRQEASQKKDEQSAVNKQEVPCPVCSSGNNLLLDAETAEVVQSLLEDLSDGNPLAGDLLENGLSASPDCSTDWLTESSVSQGGLLSDGTSPGVPEQCSTCVKGGGGFVAVPSHQLPSDPQMYWILTDEESSIILQLTAALNEKFSQKFADVDPEVAALGVQMQSLNLQTHLSGMSKYGPAIVSFVKKVPEFQALHMNDQQAVLKASSVMFLLLLSSPAYFEDTQTWLFPGGGFSVQQLGPLFCDSVHDYADFCASLKRILGKDTAAYALVMCTVLFDPLLPGVADRQRINLALDRYSLLLKHYLESRFSYQFAGRYRQALDSVIVKGRSVASNVQATMAKSKDLMDPLLRELFGFTG